jgi:SagB-type dehydrogenase family enzyme
MIALVAAPGTVFEAATPTVLTVSRPGGTPAHLDLGANTVTVLAALDDGPVPATEMGDNDQLRATVTRLARVGLLHFSAVIDGGEAMRATLTGTRSHYDDSFDPGTAGVRLSRLAIVRRHGDTMVVDAPVPGARIALMDPRSLAVVGELARARTVGELLKALPDCPAALIADAVRLLVGVGAAGPVDGDGLLAEDRHPVLRQREVADVLLHAASRGGLTDQPVGGTYPFLGTLPPAPAVLPVPAAPLVALPRPDPAALRATDPPVIAAMEDRRSTRTFGPDPVTLDQIGEFLYRTARVRAVRPPTEAMPYELSDRPYPSGGGAYDLEVYLTVLRCDGLAPGIWHYEPAEHMLSAVTADHRAVVRMLAEAHRATGGGSAPQILVTLASRFDRLSWKYRGIAYALTLKNVGVLYATMQLAATAMGLGGCPLGTGNAALFAEVTGRDPAAESSVGEFLLGSLPPVEPTGHPQ